MSPSVEVHGARGRSLLVRLRYLFLFAVVFGGSFFIFSISNRSDITTFHAEPNALWQRRRVELKDFAQSFTIKTEGCTIPALRAFDDSVINFVNNKPNLKLCKNAKYPLLDYNDTHIWIKQDNAHYYKKDSTAISCCYRPFYRPNSVANIESPSIDNRVEYLECVYFESIISVEHEFVEVYCIHNFKVINKEYFLFAPKKKLNINQLSSENIYENVTEKSAYNVLVLGIDSVSRLNFHRTMPKTLAYLQKKNSIELMGYNKVGDNTFPNLVPMLLGVDENEIKNTCWPHYLSTFDNCPFLWEWFKQAGFYTAFAEDSSRLGTFNYEKVGFLRSPTHYYVHTFMSEAEAKVANYEVDNSHLCMGSQYFYKVLLDYIEKLATTLTSSKLFGLFWEVTMTHDYLNYPMVMDDDYLIFLQNLEKIGYLEKTILILLSDHGIRWGKIRLTKQGRLEERLPFVQMLLPQSFRDNYSQAYESLKLNQRRLTTPYDIHATLLDLTNLDRIKDDELKIRSQQSYASNRSISLFLPVPLNRTCKMAGIADHWCTCNKGFNISPQSPEAVEAATALIRHLNLALRAQAGCARLALAQVVAAREMTAGAAEAGEAGWRELLLVARAQPGDGLFEATLRRTSATWTLTGTVSRLNLYGDTSHCVHHYQLKLYCYCI